jgi:hypothetical protein
MDSLHVTSEPRAAEEPGHYVLGASGSLMMPVASRPVTLEEEAPPESADGVPPVQGLAAAPTARPLPPEVEARCGPGVPGMDEVLTPGAVVLLGELHGTREIPALVGALACHAGSAGAPVLVALEVPREEQRAVDAYLESDGGEDARGALLEGTFWRRPYQDGRSSEAMLALLERVRAWRQRDGLAVSVLALDVPGQGNTRSAGLARRLSWARAREPGRTVLALVGNVQARVARGAGWDEALGTLGGHLARAGVPVRALDARFSGGTAWTCTLDTHERIDCGPGPVIVPPGMESERGLGYQGARPFLRMLDAQGAEGFHGVFYVGPVTASPPAVASLRQGF